MFHVEQVVVVGGGHAGIEAALASARLGVPTVLVTVDREWIGRMPCNPAVGGLAKGHLVREIDALGGAMGRLTDRATIQFKQLNTRKGVAVRSSRAQVDRFRYALEAQRKLRNQPGLEIVIDSVVGLDVEHGAIRGVATARHGHLPASAVVLSAGTFMEGRVVVGRTLYAAGRSGEEAAGGLSRNLRELGLTLMRMKTGTTPRLLRSSVRWKELPRQAEDLPDARFSAFDITPTLPRIQCRITATNEHTHEVIRRNLDRAPLFDGTIAGVGPRYCPSIEDKVVRFCDRDHHQLFLEPEGLHSKEVYPNGLSTSLPVSVQQELTRTIVGLEDAVIVRPGYAIEYDLVDARQLDLSLASRSIRGLYLAGQVNGTTGYEEAAAQGLMAGINAARSVRGDEPVVLRRDQAYIGVMIDDLVTRGTDEPYRMFTSRSEYRLILREGNADHRLSDLGASIGLLSDDDHRAFTVRKEAVARGIELLASRSARPGPDLTCALQGEGIPQQPRKLNELLARPGIALEDLSPWLPEAARWPGAVAREVVAGIKYAGYIERQERQVQRVARMESLSIPAGLDFDRVEGLSFEVREKFERVRPETVGQANRIPGVTPAAVTALLAHLKARPTHE